MHDILQKMTLSLNLQKKPSKVANKVGSQNQLLWKFLPLKREHSPPTSATVQGVKRDVVLWLN